MQNKGKHKTKGRPTSSTKTTGAKHKKTVDLHFRGDEYYQTLLDTIPHGIQEIDASGKITFVNEAYNKIFGYKGGEAIGESILLKLLDDNERKKLRAYLKKLVAEQSIPTPYFEKNRTKDGRIIDVRIDWNYKRDVEGHVVGFISVITDITKGKQAEEKYYNLIEHANDGIVSVDTTGMIIGFNKKAEEMFGYAREEVLGKSSYVLIPHQNKEIFKKAMKRFVTTGIGLEAGDNILEGHAVRKDGTKFPIEYSYYSIDIGGEFVATAIIRDISKRKEEEQKVLAYQNQLKALTSQITLAEEKERRRFSEFIHDEVGQQLFATQLQLTGIRDSLSSEESSKSLDDAIDSIKKVISNARSLILELSSPILHELGLVKALEWLGEQTQQNYGIMVTVNDDKQKKPLDDDVKILLYQAVRELLINIAKHAQIKNAKISIKREKATVRICVEDKGVGFCVPSGDSAEIEINGFGLFHIKERLEPFGGQLEIESQPNRGTKVTLVAPLGENFDELGT
jgi:PAS domain S-box-containing protein